MLFYNYIMLFIIIAILFNVLLYCAHDEGKFKKDKYKWSQAAIDDTEWEMHVNFILNQTYSRKKTCIGIEIL